MSRYRLRTLDVRPGTTLTRGDNSRWASDPFDTPREAAEARRRLERPFSVRVMRDVDGEPEALDFDELQEVNGVEHNWEMQEWMEFQRRKVRGAA